jgi:hypothetical protein
MSESVNPVSLTPQGPPNTVLPAQSAEERHLIEQALGVEGSDRKTLLAGVATRFPRSLEAWARLGDTAVDPIERYAYYRIGYHRGLDALRQNGWRGSGYVLWRHESNRGFLRALRGLQMMAASIGETDEAERCAIFIRQLDPQIDPRNFPSE